MTPTLHILGAGALGRLWASRLAACGWQPILLRRPNETITAQIQQTLWEPNRAAQQFTVRQQHSDDSSPIVRLLVATKAWQSLAAVESIRPRLSTDASVLVLQNGLGAQQQIVDYLKPKIVWAASTTDGAWLDRELGVHHAGYGTTRIGPMSGQTTPDWIHPLQHVPGLKLETVTKIEPILLEKVAINSAINGLTAIYDCPNGELLSPAYWPKVQLLCQETEQLLLKMKHPFSTPLEQQVQRVLELTADNISSTCQDCRAGRPTELDYINGYLLAQAKTEKLTLPTHQWLLNQLKLCGYGTFVD